MSYKVKDIGLAGQGELNLTWAADHMPVLGIIKERFEKEKPLKGVTIAASLHCTKETGVLIKVLEAGGAKVALAGSNPLTTQDNVVAALAASGTNVYAWRGQTKEEYYECINSVLNYKPDLTIDDGCDLVSTIHNDRKELLEGLRAGSEETTTGVIRLRAMEADGALKCPMVAVNDTPTKNMFDNRYGSGQSTIDGVIRATGGMLMAGKNFVMSGYGWCGQGIARRASGMGARVIVTEVDPVRALEAAMEGYSVMNMEDAAKVGDIFVTSTGCKHVIDKHHMKNMKSGAVLANSGHFNVEINIPALEEMSMKKIRVRPDVDEYHTRDGRKLYLLSEGRLVNLAAADGSACEVMDMSFANHALVAEWLINNDLQAKVYDVPGEIDHMIASLKLQAMGFGLDKLTAEQDKYLNSWDEGTV
ncbi:MAG: adenosylhomocysteinase [Candidatus Bathyarchaeota archaeon]